MDVKTSELLEKFLEYTDDGKGKLNDSVWLQQWQLLKKIYSDNQYQPLWSDKEHWNPIADSLHRFIDSCKQYGLFPSDYYVSSLSTIFSGLQSDTIHRRNAALWARADLILTNDYLSIAHDLKLGRLPKDSITLRVDSLITDSFFLANFHQAMTTRQLRPALEQLEPRLTGYRLLKAAIPAYLDSVTFAPSTNIIYPNKDSAALAGQLEKRLTELGFAITPRDTGTVKAALRKYQRQKNFTVTGRLNDNTVRSLNTTEWDRFKRIAITLDRYKMLPDTLPTRYIWVNLPSFYMQLWDNDTIYMQSKIVVGKPKTRTPVLTSKLTDMITYPQWTIPTSIIVKEVLPGLKKDTNYLAKKGYSLVDDDGNEVDPHKVNWFRYNKGIPYKVIQGSGDDNALGVLKFNFNNKYSVYLHDTNQRYFFREKVRDLSHGCVRVQDWEKMAHYIISNDSANAANPATAFKADTLRAWLGRKERHYIPIRSRIPLFIRYYTCEGKDGKIRFYDDIYGEDRILSERYFANKPID
jgi:murein L,D-transpeptidase YcbB/YkuD